MELREALIAYDPESDRIRVGPLLREGFPDWTEGFLCTTGAGEAVVRNLTGRAAQAVALSLFVELVIGEAMDAKATANALQVIDEFRQGREIWHRLVSHG